MSVPVFWVSRHAEILARGYYDQALLEAVLDRSIWRPPEPLEFKYVVLGPTRENPDAPPAACFPLEAPRAGGIVVFASRHHVDDVDWLIENLRQMPWAVVLMTSEEEWLFDWRKLVDALDPDRYRFWAWQPRPEHAVLSWRMPCGWYPNARDGIRWGTTPEGESARARADARPLDWFFGGQITHSRRRECREALDGLSLSTRGKAIYTERFLEAPLTYAEYLATMTGTKVVPCPSGPESCCTARVEEALEAGCVPIVDLRKPNDPQFDYWTTLFGPNPLTGIVDWANLPGVLEAELAGWPMNAVRSSAWWMQWKRATAHRLDDDVRAVSGNVRTSTDAADLVTVVVPTSPTPFHPSLEHLSETLGSVRERLPDAEIVLVADGVRPEQEHLRGPYEEYLRRVVWSCQHEWRNVVPVICDEWGHQANAVRRALEFVTTPLLLFVEHDTPLVGPIDFEGLAGLVLSGEANYVRFHFDVDIHPDHQPGMLDETSQNRAGHGHYEPLEIPSGTTSQWVWDQKPVPVRRTKTWWQRPHLASARFYREVVLPRFTPESRTMIEDLMHGVVSTDHLTRGDAAWWDWRLFVYTPEGPPEFPALGMKRSSHLDSRGESTGHGEPKFDMKFA